MNETMKDGVIGLSIMIIILFVAVFFLGFVCGNFESCKDLWREDVPIIMLDKIPYCFVEIETKDGAKLITAHKYLSHDYFKLVEGD